MQFTEAVTLSGCGNVDLSSGTCGGVTSLGNHAYQVELSGADENACLTLTLVNVAGVSSGRRLVGINQVRVVVLKGDVDASGLVETADLTAIQGQIGQAVTMSNFRRDVNADGEINIFDLVAANGNMDASASCTLPEVPLHWQYSWDAENRLVAVAPAVPAAGDKKVVYTYDYMSRRVQKRVFAWNATLNGGTGDWEANPEVYQRFVYDQWNVALVLDGPSRTITHKYTWGLDLSGLAGQGAAGFSPRGPSDGATAGIHAAGGIGGLLAVEAPQAVGEPLRHWYFYDGNGNVGQLLAYDATGTTVNAAPAAKYEYDPYGQLIQTAGTYADANPFRFSTKWFDATTGLGYWGYRYYSPNLGRWMNRDPIGESGGRNLFLYVDNRPTNAFDALGLERCCSDAWFDANKPVPPPPTGQTRGLIDVGGHYNIFGIWVAIGSYSDTWTGRWIKLYDKTVNRCGTSGTVETKIVFTYDSGVKTTSTLSASAQVTQAVQNVKASVQSGYSFSLENSNSMSITDEDKLELKACTYRRYQKWQLIEEHGITGSGTVYVQWTSLGSLRPAGTFSVSARYIRYTTNFFERDCEWSCRKSSGCSSN